MKSRYGFKFYDRLRRLLFQKAPKYRSIKFNPLKKGLGLKSRGIGPPHMESAFRDFITKDFKFPNLKKFVQLERDVLKDAGNLVCEDWAEVQEDLIEFIEWGIETKEPLAIYLAEKMAEIFRLKMSIETERKIEAFFLYQNNKSKYLCVVIDIKFFLEIDDKIQFAFANVGKINRKYARPEYGECYLNPPHIAYDKTILILKYQPDYVDNLELYERKYPIHKAKLRNFEPMWMTEMIKNNEIYR
jgi:hypothetical protein